jgi:hypothetical protein
MSSEVERLKPAITVELVDLDVSREMMAKLQSDMERASLALYVDQHPAMDIANSLSAEVERLRGELRTAKGTIARIEADRLELVAEVERLKLPLKKLVRAWEYGDCDETLLNDAEEIVEDAKQALNPKPREQPPK